MKSTPRKHYLKDDEKEDGADEARERTEKKNIENERIR